MPSDDRRTAALDALAARRALYRSALAATRDELRAFIERHREAADDRRGQIAATLGPIGVRHIDVDRLVGVIATEPAVGPGARDVVVRALAVLDALEAQGDEAFALTLAPGESLFEMTDRRLADLGRAMGAGRVAALARTGRYRPAEHDLWLEAFPFGLWSQEERRLAPPLVIELEGRDLRPGGLAEFLDGSVTLVFLVRGETSPAPLVRLITPRTFVAQGADATVLDRLAAWQGPAVAALVGERDARFVHDPARGDGIGERLQVEQMPALDVRRRTGSLTAAQQQEEIDQLLALQAAARVAVPMDAPTATTADPVDKLAAWLLQQADLSRS